MFQLNAESWKNIQMFRENSKSKKWHRQHLIIVYICLSFVLKWEHFRQSFFSGMMGTLPTSHQPLDQYFCNLYES